MFYAGATHYIYTHNNISFRPVIGYDCLHWTLISGQWDNEELMFTLRYHILYSVSIRIHVLYAILICSQPPQDDSFVRRQMFSFFGRCLHDSRKTFFFGQKYRVASLGGDLTREIDLRRQYRKWKKIVPAT